MSGSIDTLLAVKTLRGAGFDEAGAEAIVAVVRQASELPSIDHLATKGDLEKAVLATKNDLEKAALATKNDLERAALATKNDLETAVLATKNDLETAVLATKNDLEKATLSLKLFVASTVLGGAAVIVLAQIVTKALGLAA